MQWSTTTTQQQKKDPKLHRDKTNETEIEILNSTYQKPVAVYISAIIPKY